MTAKFHPARTARRGLTPKRADVLPEAERWLHEPDMKQKLTGQRVILAGSSWWHVIFDSCQRNIYEGYRLISYKFSKHCGECVGWAALSVCLSGQKLNTF
ncbi:MAG: hypothetical protein IPN53_00835 [Comamonadaceae bacterium]|nr:hypothetical protein [Comamonadaceae bacterium]